MRAGSALLLLFFSLSFASEGAVPALVVTQQARDVFLSVSAEHLQKIERLAVVVILFIALAVIDSALRHR